jgi:hypothetical protein
MCLLSKSLAEEQAFSDITSTLADEKLGSQTYLLLLQNDDMPTSNVVTHCLVSNEQQFTASW